MTVAAVPPTPPVPPDDAVFRVIVDTSPYLYAIVDDQVCFRYVNPAATTILGYEPHELIGTSAVDIIHPEDFDLALGALAQLVDEFDADPDGGIPLPVRLIRADGSLTYVELGAIPRLDDPGVHGVIIRGRPMTGQQSLDQALEALVASSPLDDVLEYLVTSIEHELRGAHAAIGHGWTGTTFESLVTRHLPPELCGAAAAAGVLPDDELQAAPWAEALACNEPAYSVDIDELPPGLRAAAAGAGLHSCWAMPVVVPPDDAQVACIIVWRPVASTPFVSHLEALKRASRLTSLAFERRHTEALLRHAALHDPLTGLANRAQFFLRLEASATADRVATDAAPDDRPPLLAVLYLDLDAFKPVNDTHGHATGDDVLRVVTERIAESIRPDDLAARLGGDEFAVLCQGIRDPAEAVAVAERLIAAVGRPIDLGGVRIPIGLSVGVAVGDPATCTGADLLKLVDAADRALYEAKHAGKGRWHLAPNPPRN